LESLSDQRSRIEGNIKSEDERTLSERERLASLIDGLEGEILQLEAQLKVQNERLDVIASELEAGRQLRAKGILTAPELRRRELMQLEQKQAVSAITQQISAKRNQLTEAEFNLAQLPTVMAQRVQSLRNDLAAVEQRLAETKGRQSYVLRAPVGGRVTTVQARVGQTADPQKLQLEIIPVGSELQAELYLPARAIGFVGSGQKVRLLYDAFPYQHFGSHSGRVVSISHTMLTSADSGGPIRLNEPAYRIIAKLDQTHIEAFGKQVPLQPDMLLKADIILERRTLVEWVLNPLRSVRM
jgi:membrane fusion protein